MVVGDVWNRVLEERVTVLVVGEVLEEGEEGEEVE